MAKQRKKITAKKNLSIEEQEKALQELHQKDATTQVKKPEMSKSTKKKVQRVTIDFPVDIYQDLKAETEANGHTLKWFIVNLVKKHFANK